MAGAVFLEGEKVTLRTIEQEDAETFADIVNDFEVRRYLGIRKP